jgi:protein-S-isoprenylcysteine O-methyltransferase Ste14
VHFSLDEGWYAAMATLLKTLLFTVVVPGTVTVYIPVFWMRPDWPTSAGLLQWLGLTVLAIGIAIYAWCASEFTFRGGGTPAPIDPPKRLVMGGLYRYSRNPMYVGILSILCGEALYFASLRHLGYAAGVFAMFESFIIFYEEPHLRQAFGEAYLRYCRAVPRWLGKAAA